MLIHIQLPGASFVAPPYTWLRRYGRRVKPGSRPVVILQRMGPVMFVFDVSDTEPIEEGRPLPRLVERPFEVKQGRVGSELLRTKENAARDGVQIVEYEAGSLRAGQIGCAKPGRFLKVLVRKRPDEQHIFVPLMFELLLNSKLSPEAKHATVCHELGHLYCGHLGTPNDRWWPDRCGLAHDVCEFEAESVCYLICSRLGIASPSHEYLAGYLRDKADIPSISLDCGLKAAGLIEQMGRRRLKPREQGQANEVQLRASEKSTGRLDGLDAGPAVPIERPPGAAPPDGEKVAPQPPKPAAEMTDEELADWILAQVEGRPA